MDTSIDRASPLTGWVEGERERVRRREWVRVREVKDTGLFSIFYCMAELAHFDVILNNIIFNVIILNTITLY